MEVRKSSHGMYRLEYHVVWTCKYRRRVLKSGMPAYLHRVLLKLLKSMPGVELLQIGGEADHMHMIMEIAPKYSIAEVMGRLKSQSASAMRRKYSWLHKVYWDDGGVLWSPGYFVSSVGVNEDDIREYVKHQGMQDKGQLRMQL